MKLSRVWLKFPFLIPGSGMENAQTELGENECLEMRYDEKTYALVFGDDYAFGINWDNVVRWERRNDELVCPACERSFQSGQALGGHRSKCKGKVAE